MAKRTNDQSLKDAIDGMLKSFHLDQKLNEIKVVNSWEKVMGKTVSNRTTRIFMRDKKLFIYLNSASLRDELHQAKDKIVNLLNTEAGDGVVEEVVFC